MKEYLLSRKERLTREYRDNPKITNWARLQECKYILKWLAHDATSREKAAGTAKGGSGALPSSDDNAGSDIDGRLTMSVELSGWRKRQIALDPTAENARQLGLDYEPNKTVIEMAREAGICTWLKPPSDVVERIERFAALVRADERDKWMERAHIMILGEREGCHALRQALSNPHEHCQISAHAYDMAIAAYGAAIRARGQA